MAPSPAPYADETAGQLAFYDAFQAYLKPVNELLVAHTDGVVDGNLLEFKLAINDTPAVLFQAVKYLSKLRMSGREVPAHILLVDLNARRVRVYDSADYREAIHQTYATAASRSTEGFRVVADPEVIDDYLVTGAARVLEVLSRDEYLPIDITQECVVPWAERFYREVPGSDKENLLAETGELRKPVHFERFITSYDGPDWSEFKRILDRLNDKLKKIELGAFYTPQPYVDKSYELVLEAIARVPHGNDYVIIDRCAGTGNLQRGLDAIPCPGCKGSLSGSPHSVLAHCIVNTFEKFEYLELLREFATRVRAVIPPTVAAGDDSGFGTLRNGDALSDRFVLGVPVRDAVGSPVVDDNGAQVRQPNSIQPYLDDDKCTVILFENPPYADVAGMEAQKVSGRQSFGWKDSWVRKQMDAEWGKSKSTNNRAIRELTNLFIWSGFRYYLRQPTDSYVVFSPTKYFKSQGLVKKVFVGGFLFNRRHFHARKDAGVSVVLWANVDDDARTAFPLTPFDISKTGEIFPGALHKDNPGPQDVVVHTTRALLSSLYDTRRLETDEPGIVCEPNGVETNRKTFSTAALWGPDIIGYLVADAAAFEQTDLRTVLTRVSLFSATNGFALRSDNFLTKLPLFVTGRMASEGRYWIRGVVNRTADNGDNFSSDRRFLKECLIFTALAHHNKVRSFAGTDGRKYRNELCFDEGTLASGELAKLVVDHPLSETEKALMSQWAAVQAEAKKVTVAQRFGERKPVYDQSIPWGAYQIAFELNTKHPVTSAKGKTTQVADSPDLNGALRTLSKMLAAYHAEVITPSLWSFGLVR
ncbi:hypothetical protein [Microbacterium lacticum]